MGASVLFERVYERHGVSAVATIGSGTLRTGMRADFNGIALAVKSIIMKHKRLESAPAGSTVGIRFHARHIDHIAKLSGKEICFETPGIISRLRNWLRRE